ncbi:MAG: hypothetical protein WC763_04800 [Candidatus Paceibacterota bacterium]
MSNNCAPSPYSAKTNPFSEKVSPFAAKTSPYDAPSFCPALLQENGYALLQENGGLIEL